MDPEIRELERRLAANPRDIEAGRRLAAIHRRIGRRYGGRRLEDWAADIKPAFAMQHVSEEAITFLASLGALACEQVPAILIWAEERGIEPRVVALTALGAIGDPRGRPVIIKNLSSKQDKVQRAAAEALAGLADEAVIAELEQLAQSRKLEARRGALLALACLGGDRARACIARALKHKDPKQRLAAQAAAGRLGDPAFIPQVLKASRNKDLASEALLALAVLDPARAAPLIRPRLAGGELGALMAAIEAAALTGEASLTTPLLALLKHAKPKVRRAAAAALASTVKEEAPQALIEAINDRDYEVRLEAALALGAIGDRRALPALEAHRDEPARLRSIARLLPMEELLARYRDGRHDGDQLLYQVAEVLGAEGAPLYLDVLRRSQGQESGTGALHYLAKFEVQEAVPLIRSLCGRDKIFDIRARQALQRLEAEAPPPAKPREESGDE